MGRAVHVETVIRRPGAVDRLWHLSQDPHEHPRWDLRFSAITPTGTDDAGRGAFRYELALPHPRCPLHTVTGTGVSTAERRDADGRGTSALGFDTDDALSPLAAGSGYWRYQPLDGGVRFVTGYDYRPGWGRLGSVLDPWLVRPLVGWATAWSFDRLRLWIERDLDPARTRDAALRWAGVRASVALAVALVARRRSPSAGVLVGVVALVAALATPAPPGVPSARRCTRRPSTRRPSTRRAA